MTISQVIAIKAWCNYSFIISILSVSVNCSTFCTVRNLFTKFLLEDSFQDYLGFP